MKPTLLVLAAGMGSRYGGLKQIASVGASGETIIEFSIYDAIRSGFGKIVFVIRKSFEKEFNEKIINKVKSHIDVDYVFQEIDTLPEGFVVSPERVKPWGTGHAILVAESKIDTPFTVINGDDFYGNQAFSTMADYLKKIDEKSNQFSMVAYDVSKTLSKNGTVSRGVCSVNADKLLVAIKECANIKEQNNEIVYSDKENNIFKLSENTPVSMNFWGFTTLFFKLGKPMFIDFLKENINVNTAEFGIPTLIDNFINNKSAFVTVLNSDAQWFGVTYKEDMDSVVNQINELIAKGLYPKKLF